MKEKDTKNDVLSRFVEFKENSNMSWNAFSAGIGMKQNTVFNQVNGLRALSLDTIINTLEAYGELSAEWLLRGNGNMLLSQSGEELELKSDARLDALVDTITLLQETIKMKNATIDALQAELSQYKRKAKKA